MNATELRELDMWIGKKVLGVETKKIGNYWTLTDSTGKDIAGLEELREETCWLSMPHYSSWSSDAWIVLIAIAERTGHIPRIEKEDRWWFKNPIFQAGNNYNLISCDSLEEAICLYAKIIFA